MPRSFEYIDERERLLSADLFVPGSQRAPDATGPHYICAPPGDNSNTPEPVGMFATPKRVRSLGVMDTAEKLFATVSHCPVPSTPSQQPHDNRRHIQAACTPSPNTTPFSLNSTGSATSHISLANSVDSHSKEYASSRLVARKILKSGKKRRSLAKSFPRSHCKEVDSVEDPIEKPKVEKTPEKILRSGKKRRSLAESFSRSHCKEVDSVEDPIDKPKVEKTPEKILRSGKKRRSLAESFSRSHCKEVDSIEDSSEKVKEGKTSDQSPTFRSPFAAKSFSSETCLLPTPTSTSDKNDRTEQMSLSPEESIGSGETGKNILRFTQWNENRQLSQPRGNLLACTNKSENSILDNEMNESKCSSNSPILPSSRTPPRSPPSAKRTIEEGNKQRRNGRIMLACCWNHNKCIVGGKIQTYKIFVEDLQHYQKIYFANTNV